MFMMSLSASMISMIMERVLIIANSLILATGVSLLSMEVIVSLGRLVRKLRLERGMTQEELAARTGMEQNTLSALEHGKIQLPSQPVLHALADVFELSEVDLLKAAGWVRSDGDSRSGNEALSQTAVVLFRDVYERLEPPAKDALLAQLRGLRRAQAGNEDEQAET